jgi:Ran GTPase-activating protein (RanGAP) involved in mRNA processing and transport
LKILNLSKNRLTDSIHTNLNFFIKSSHSLEEFYLYWNQLKEKSCQAIFEAILKITNVKVLDFSWNRMNAQLCLEVIHLIRVYVKCLGPINI